METINSNPNGLHQKYVIRKVVGIKRSGFFGEDNFTTKAVDKDAEYFVLRLDNKGSDPKHIEACRIGIHAYANAIKDHIPKLAKDLIERYPLSIDTSTQKEAVEFANWISTNKWEKCGFKKEEDRYRNGIIPAEWIYKTTSELYQLFKDNKQ